MLDSYLKLIESFLAVYGVTAVFLLGIAEEIIFFIPMSLLFVGAGFFLISPNLSFWPALAASFYAVALPATIGVLIGGLVIYWLIYWGGKKLIKRFGAYVNLRWEDIEELHRRFSRGYVDETVLFSLRVVPILPIGIVSIFCGLIRLGLWEFIWTTFVGTMIRIAGLSLLGWYLGREYIQYALQIAAVEKYLVAVFLAVVLVVIFYLYNNQSARSRGEM